MDKRTIKRRALKALGQLDQWHHRCHEASTVLVRSGLLGPCRVARGSCPGVGGQHSWVVLGMDCYDENATIIDPTLWSYVADIKKVEGIVVVKPKVFGHRPHGSGSIWDYGRPELPTDEIIDIEPECGWSDGAAYFIETLGPLDKKGWWRLAHCPVEEWPAAEIISVIDDRWPACVPIDIVGMLTEKNPGGLYLPVDQDAA